MFRVVGNERRGGGRSLEYRHALHGSPKADLVVDCSGAQKRKRAAKQRAAMWVYILMARDDALSSGQPLPCLQFVGSHKIVLSTVDESASSTHFHSDVGHCIRSQQRCDNGHDHEV